MHRFLLIIGLLCVIVASPSLATSNAAPLQLQSSDFGSGISCMMPTAEMIKTVGLKRCGKNINGSAVFTCHFPPMFVGNEVVIYLRDEATAFEPFPQRIAFSAVPYTHFRPPRLVIA